MPYWRSEDPHLSFTIYGRDWVLIPKAILALNCIIVSMYHCLLDYLAVGDWMDEGMDREQKSMMVVVVMSEKCNTVTTSRRRNYVILSSLKVASMVEVLGTALGLIGYPGLDRWRRRGVESRAAS